ncbi:MAG TPA: tetratricopeptide repeat protein [Isosphaeraceae bacterium]|nr:tetratricopeptide repeat protein [Isosphaeraceae bacterium]
MRVKTIKRLAILIAVLGLVSGTAVWGWNWQITRMAHAKALEAESAVKKGDFATAGRLYREHLALIPDDVEIQLAYADTLARGGSIAERAEALQVYGNVLRRSRYIGRDDVRRKQMELKVKAGRLLDEGGAEFDLKMLLSNDANKNDGELWFWMGRCAEAGKNDAAAATYYRSSIKADASPEIKIDAYWRLATVLRSRLDKPREADQAIEKMVESHPSNYKVFLERGRYRRRFDLPDSAADFQKALQLSGGEPAVYVEMAKAAIAEGRQQNGAARQILEDGLKKWPSSAMLCRELAIRDLEIGRVDQAVETLERGLDTPAETRDTPERGLKISGEVVDKADLLWLLARVLARSGDTAKLRLRIEQLKGVGVQTTLVDFLTAHYYVNTKDFRKARQILVPIDSKTGLPADIRAMVKDLLAICHSQLGEPGKQQEFYRQALAANPQDSRAKQGLIDSMVKQGDIEGAIKEYNKNRTTLTPGERLHLAQLLIVRNRQRSKPQRDWSEAAALIDDASSSSPELTEPAMRLRAELCIAQEKPAEAKDILEKARSQFPKSVALWVAAADLMATQKQFDAASALLAQAKDQLGSDRVELQLERAKLAVAEGGPQVAAKLNALGQDIDAFPKEDRARILNALGLDLYQLQDFPAAGRFWSRMAEQEPNNLDLRLRLLDVACQTANIAEIDDNIKKIKEIEGNDGSIGRYCDINYLIWQAQRAMDKDPREAQRLRTKARSDLNDLDARRPDWSHVPLTMAKIEQQELLQPGLRDDEIRANEENIIRSYLKAIDLGEHSSAVLRSTVQLLFKNKRGIEAIDLINRIPLESQLSADLTRLANQFALANRDFKGAEDIARKAVAANPDDFMNQFWLVRVLLQSGKQEDALTVLRNAVDRAPKEPDRWLTLVQFLLMTRQPDQAAKAINTAEANLPPDRAPLALAQYCELMVRFYGAANEQATTKWLANARSWYQKAQAAHPDDISIARRITEFYLGAKLVAEAESELDAILRRDAGASSDQIRAWARRTKALILASSTDPRRVRSALAVLEPPGQAALSGDGQKALDDPDDLRVLAQVLSYQRTEQDRQRAIDILNSLVTKNTAKPDDRFLLAQLYEASGIWDKAREEYLALNAKTRSARDLETLNRRPQYLLHFAAKSLLRNRTARNEQALSDVQDVIDDLKQIQPDAIATLALQVDLYRARNQLDAAADLIRTTADRPDLAPSMLKQLAELAERIDKLDLAEQVHKKYADSSNSPLQKYPLVIFLAKNDRLEKALDICEPLWANPRDMESVAQICIDAISYSSKYDRAQFERAAAWLEKAREAAETQNWNSTSTVLSALASIRERQERFQDAEALYKHAIDKGHNPIAYNNLAWLMVLRNGGAAKEALAYVERAIALGGPLRSYLDTRAVIYMALGQPQKAISDLEKVVETDPSPAELFHLAQAYLQANKQQKAKEDLRAAKDKGLPKGLHSLEMSAYKKLLEDLGPL